ncbi:hypothetical protein U8527_10335 [Kordia algicida OT-1]|uniref:Lipoprotein n=1 Tax=Kordia algicida OT-1 TaxID=391587 RepID=A9DW32_9FLAO|nr:hypothetical protein [Kordia algicida]EDP96503.1 hypothetical protein KAOT1_03802 [Kordia algicida OT-1]
MKKRIFKLMMLVIAIVFTYNCSVTKETKQEIALPVVASKSDLLKSKLGLTDKELEKVVKNDSVTNQVLLSLKDSLSSKKIRKHLDPFIAGTYNTKQTCVLLKLQTRFKNKSLSLLKNKDSVKLPRFNSMEGIDNYLKMTDSLIAKSFNRKADSIKKDSTKQQKKQ